MKARWRLKLAGKFWTVALTTSKAIRQVAIDTKEPGYKPRKYFGLTVPSERVILISGEHTTRRDLIDTVTHEVLHAEYPDSSHRKIEQVAASVAKVLDRVL